MTPWVRRLLIGNVVVFLLTQTVLPALYWDFAFVPARFLMRPWTALTYTFLHADFMHLLFNMIGLFFFGPRLEERLGGRDFLILYFGSGMGGAILSFIFAPASAVVGASGAVFGVLLGFAYFWPRENIHIWGVIPIQARWLAILLVAVSLYFGFSSGRSSIAHFAHLGGLVLAFGYLKIRERLIRMKRKEALKEFSPPPKLKRADESALRKRWKAIDLKSLHPLNREEAEALLHKVGRYGARSLSNEERAFLDRISGEI